MASSAQCFAGGSLREAFCGEVLCERPFFRRFSDSRFMTVVNLSAI